LTDKYSIIGSIMAQQYLAVKARNMITGETVISKDLSGQRLELRQRTVAALEARLLADKMNRRTGGSWQGFVEVFTA
jgi:hypothetical protein